MTKFTLKSFSVGVGSDLYRQNFDRIFREGREVGKPHEHPVVLQKDNRVPRPKKKLRSLKGR